MRKFRFRKLKARNYITIGIGLFLITFSLLLLLFDNPFKNKKNDGYVIETSTTEDVETEEENGEKKAGKGAVYSTEYGDMITTKDEEKKMKTILDSVFNVSYRAVKSDPETFRTTVMNNFEYIFFDLERDDEGYTKEEPTMSFDFADELVSLYADKNTEMKVEFKPEYSFKDSDELITYLNDKLSVTFLSGSDLKYLSKIFGIKDAELNQTYEVDYCLGYVIGDGEKPEIMIMVPKYLTVKEAN